MLRRVFLLAALLIALAGCGAGYDPDAVPTSTPVGAQLDFQGEALRFAAAIEAEDFATMEAMVRGGFNPDTHFSTRSGIPLVAWPIVSRDKASLRKMLELGADPNVAKPYEPGNPLTMATPSFYDNAMLRAAMDTDREYLEILIEHGGDPNARGIDGDTLIDRLTVYDLSFERTEWLLALGADIDARSDSSTLLVRLMEIGVNPRALRLLELGANPMPMRWVPAPRGPDNRLLPQPNLPPGGESNMLYDEQGQLVMAPYLGVVEAICWEEPPTPATAEVQRRMQAVLKARNVACPPPPVRLGSALAP
jgi:hypothetical protein